ncbi:MAG: 6-bladed beta-propeller [Cyclobacteriaceae bacterium]
MRSQVISFVIIICIIYSCNDKSKYDKIDIDLSKYESIVDLYQYSDTINLIKLETTQESLISGISRIIKDDTILIILDANNKSVLLFHSNGRFYNTIRRWGKGPGEYINIDDIAVDKESDVIYVYDDHLRKVFSYDYLGNFLSDLYLPDFIMRSFAKKKNGNFLAFTPDLMHLRNGVWEFDTEGNVIREYASVNKKHKLAWSAYPYFARIDEKFSYLNYYDNYIYTLNEDKLEKKLKIKIKQKIPDKYLPFREGVDESFTGEYYMPSSLNETHNYYYFRNTSFVAKPGRIHVFIEKKSNQLIIANSLICDFEDYQNVQRLFSNNGKNFIGVLESSTGNNPALVFFNLKPIQ